MNFNYEKIRNKFEHGGNQWTGYSDLFLVLSTVFLLLYVIANLRSGAVSIASHGAIQMAKQEVDELRKQVQAYNVLKEDYLKKGASEGEVQMYQELMSKLSLLEDGAKQEHMALSKQAQEAQEKEAALNHYQAMVKNIINANLVAQSRLKKREDIIQDKEEVIQDKSEELAVRESEVRNLHQNIQTKESQIDKNNETISQIENQLNQRVKQLHLSYRDNQKSKEKMQQEVAKLQAESQNRIQSLRSENNKVASQLLSAQSQVEAKTKESNQLLSALTSKQQQYQKSIEDMRAAHQAALAREKGEYEQGLRQAHLSAEARLAKERAYRDGPCKKPAPS